MNNLQILNLKNHDNTLDSRNVAQMLEKEHSELLKDIRKYIQYFNEGKIPSVDFFLESKYIDKKNQERPNYQITKKGCEFLAHKLTGQKGAIFTAKYINAFDELREKINLPQNNQIIEMVVNSQQNMLTMINTLAKTVENLSNQIGKKEEINNIEDIKDKEIDKLIKEQGKRQTLKILLLPPNLINTVNTLLRQENRNFSYISRYLKSKGHDISFAAVSRYYRKTFKGGK